MAQSSWFIKKMVELGNLQLKTETKQMESPYFPELTVLFTTDNNSVFVEMREFMFTKVMAKLDGIIGGYDKLVGTDTSVPFVTLLGSRTNKPASFVASKSTGPVTQAMYGAKIEFEETCVLVTDVLTDGKLVVDTIKQIIKRGGVVKNVVCLFNRDEGGLEYIKYHYPNIDVWGFLTIGTVLSTCTNNKLITEYTAEQIEYYREMRYTMMIKHITTLNDDNKELYYQKEPVKWALENYQKVWCFDSGESSNSSNSSNNNLFLDITTMDWDTAMNKLSQLDTNIKNIVVDFCKVKDWDNKKQLALLTLTKSGHYNIIYKSSVCLPSNSEIDTFSRDIGKYLLMPYDNCDIPNSLIVDSVIINIYVAQGMVVGEILMNEIKQEYRRLETGNVVTGTNIKGIYLNLLGPGMTELMTNYEFWSEFKKFILQITNNSNINIDGVIIPYYRLVDKSNCSLPRKLKINRLVPIILDVSTNSAFHLDETMITQTIGIDYIESFNAITKIYNMVGFSHIMVGSDLLESNLPINTKFCNYLKFATLLENKTFNMATLYREYMQLTQEHKYVFPDKMGLIASYRQKRDALNKKQDVPHPTGLITNVYNLFAKAISYLVPTSLT